MSDPLYPSTPAYTNTKSARPTAIQGFRIYQDQIDNIKKIYGRNASEMMRLLIDELLKGRVPAVRTKMLKKGLI